MGKVGARKARSRISMNKAYFVKKVDDPDYPKTGGQTLYRLDPPLKDNDGNKHQFVVVSAHNVPFSGPETYIFPANVEGTILEWCELDGSFRGMLDHAAALRGAGYEIIND